MTTTTKVPAIGITELRDQHAKVYCERSVINAIKEYQHREGLASFSEAGRALWLIAFENKKVFGGYVYR